MTSSLIAAVVLVAVTLFVRWLEPRMAFFPPRRRPRRATRRPLRSPDHRHRGRGAAAGVAPGADAPVAPSSTSTAMAAISRTGRLSSPGCRARLCRAGGRLPRLRTQHRPPTERGLYRDVDAAVAHPWPDAQSRLPLIYWGGRSEAPWRLRRDGAQAGRRDYRSGVSERPRGRALVTGPRGAVAARELPLSSRGMDERA